MLAYVLTAVNNELVRLGVLQDSTPLFLGANPKRMKASPVSIFWVPIKSKGAGPDVSASPDVQSALEANGGSVPRCLRTRLLSVDCYLWAGGPAPTDDYSATELLLSQVLTAIDHIYPGAYQFGGEKWLEQGSEANILGHRCIAEFGFKLPVNEFTPTNPKSAVQVTEITQTVEIGLLPDGSTVVVQP